MNPCHNCEERCIYCHAKCKLYEEWRREQDAIRTAKQKEDKLLHGIIEQSKNRERRKRK